jgi:hypothetical protein
MNINGILSALFFFCLVSRGFSGEAPRSLKVVHFPEAAYLGERTTFVVEAQPTGKVAVEFNGEEIVETSFAGERREFNLVLQKSGMLVFKQGAASVAFHIVQPTDNVPLHEDMGYLYSDKGPAILMARHLHPPKHDRRWETLRLLKRLFSDPRPRVSSGVVLGGYSLPEGSGAPATNRPPATSAGFWTSATASNCLSEINGFIVTGTNGLRKADVLLLALMGRDFEQGVNPIEYRIKMEWCLQCLGQLPFAHAFVSMPLLNASQEERFAGPLQALRTAALGNRAVFLGSVRERKEDDKSASRNWFGRVQTRIEEKVKMPEPGSPAK